VSNIPSTVNCVQNTVCSFSVVASDPDSDPVTWVLATSGQSGIVQPPGASVASGTGIYTWDTTGQPLGLYATNVIVTDHVAGNPSTGVDFKINVIAGGAGVAPTFGGPTPTCGTTVSGTVSSPMTFDVQASDTDVGDTVSLSVSGVPVGATFTPPLPASGNPVTTQLSWTPASAGQQVITFTATDSTLQQTFCSLTLDVNGPVAAAVPSLSWVGLGALGLLLGAFGVALLRARG
jgi:hypothetical protein